MIYLKEYHFPQHRAASVLEALVLMVEVLVLEVPMVFLEEVVAFLAELVGVEVVLLEQHQD